MTASKIYALEAERMDGKRRGVVLALLCGEEGGVTLKCADSEEREFYIPREAIMRISGSVLYRTECAKRAAKSVLRLNAPCFDERGAFMGLAEDYVLKGMTVKSVIINGKSYPAARFSAGDVVIVKRRDISPAALAAKDMFIDAVLSSDRA